MLLKDLETDVIEDVEFEEVGMNWLTANRKTLEANTTNRRLASLRRFAAWAGWDCTFTDYKAPQALPGKPHPLSEGIDGVKAMADAATSMDQRVLIVLCGLAGLRISEAREVDYTNFDTDRMELHVHGKGAKERKVPISSAAWEYLQPAVLKSYMNDGAPLCSLQDRAARGAITSAGRRAKMSRRVASHDLRATFATSVYNKTKDIRLVQVLLGHSSSKQTEIYVGVTDEALREGVEL